MEPFSTPWWIDRAHKAAEMSPDRSTKCGAVIARQKYQVIAACNDYPAGVDGTVEARHQRPAKYLWIEHAERNAIYRAAQHGMYLRGTTIYLTHVPCANCARAIIQAGIVAVFYQNALEDRWSEEVAVALEMLDEAGVLVTKVDQTNQGAEQDERTVQAQKAGQQLSGSVEDGAAAGGGGEPTAPGR